MQTDLSASTSEKKSIQKLQRAIVDGLEDVKAQDIQVFDTEHLSALFERIIVASGNSNRQTRALAASVRDAVRAAGYVKPRIEGEENGEWIIVDCGPAVVHIMQPAIRQYYTLEDIWGEKPVRMRIGKAPAKKAAAVAVKAPAKAVAEKRVSRTAARTAAKKEAAATAGSTAEDKPVRKAAAKAETKTAAKTAAKTATKTAAKTVTKTTTRTAGKAAASAKPAASKTAKAETAKTSKTARAVKTSATPAASAKKATASKTKKAP